MLVVLQNSFTLDSTFILCFHFPHWQQKENFNEAVCFLGGCKKYLFALGVFSFYSPILWNEFQWFSSNTFIHCKFSFFTLDIVWKKNCNKSFSQSWKLPCQAYVPETTLIIFFSVFLFTFFAADSYSYQQHSFLSPHLLIASQRSVQSPEPGVSHDQANILVQCRVQMMQRAVAFSALMIILNPSVEWMSSTLEIIQDTSRLRHKVN